MNLSALGAVAVCTVAFFVTKKKHKGGPIDIHAEEFLTKHNYSGLLSDIEFFLHFPKEENARRAAAKLEARTYKLIAPIALDSSNQWAVKVMVNMQVAEDELYCCEDVLNHIAVREGGEYDGWGVPRTTGEQA